MMVAGDSLTATGSSQSLHSSDDRREPNPLRAKGGRKVECEMTKQTKRRAKNYIAVTVPFNAATPKAELEARESTREIPAWANRTVWTDRMLNALSVGVRGGKWHALMDKVESELNLFASARKVVAKEGAAGVDRQSTSDFAEHEIDEIRRLHRQLRDQSYRPQPVRRVWIPKPGSPKGRPLGIPTVTGKSTPEQSAFGLH
jgi:RNA-directed DNA polymerase